MVMLVMRVNKGYEETGNDRHNIGDHDELQSWAVMIVLSCFMKWQP